AVLDVLMPEIDGIELAAAIRTRRTARELPIIFLSSIGRSEISAQASMRGLDVDALAQGFITKPARASVLLERVTAALGVEAIQGGRTAARNDAIDTGLGQRVPLRILVAEDNPVNQRVATRMLERLGYRPEVAANGLEVLDALARQPF